MSDQSAADNLTDVFVFDSELSDREVFAIGKIVSLWGALEHEIFWQTAEYFDESVGQLPKAMNNVQSSQILELWKTHVVDKAADKRREVLQKQYDEIKRLSDFRNAIVHGMWDWSRTDLVTINVTRVRNGEMITVQFTAEQLTKFALALMRINSKIRYPEGFEDYRKEISEQGTHAYISRRFAAMVTNSPSANDWFPFGHEKSSDPEVPPEPADQT